MPRGNKLDIQCVREKKKEVKIKERKKKTVNTSRK